MGHFQPSHLLYLPGESILFRLMSGFFSLAAAQVESPGEGQTLGGNTLIRHHQLHLCARTHAAACTHIHKTTNKTPYCFSRGREWFNYLISSIEPMPYRDFSIRWVAIAPTYHSPPSTMFTVCLVLTVGHLRDFLGKKNVWRNLFLSSFFFPPQVWWSLKDFLRKCWIINYLQGGNSTEHKYYCSLNKMMRISTRNSYRDPF